ncbi:cytochrome b561 and DOMON domain-containing protein At3g07570 [Euphorbia lathyris]|uniref:cytochrome b561 and DOMON domain-containing protein At3g07570 n=1 Tax=Euphorbia lathyris TaxID=212925 RepID=UPI003313F7D0
MKITLILIILLCGLLSEIANSQTDSCSSNLNLNRQLPFDISSLHCAPVWNNYNYVLRYVQTAANIWSFVLSAPEENSFVAIGFSNNGFMVGSSAMVGWISSDDNIPVIKQYLLTGQTPAQVIPDSGNLNVTYSMITSQSSRIYLAFQLTTDLPSPRLIYSRGQSGILPSAPSYRLTQHRDEVSTVLNYNTGTTSKEDVGRNSGLRKSHGALNMISWGALMIIGGIIARYGKDWDPIWFYAHTGIQSLAFLLGTIGVIIGFVLEDRIHANVSTHKGLGIFILVLGCLQVMAFLARPEKSSKLRTYWNWYHYSVGRTLMAFAIGNVFYGIHLGEKGSGWNVGYGILLAIFFLISVILEIRFWRKNSN